MVTSSTLAARHVRLLALGALGVVAVGIAGDTALDIAAQTFGASAAAPVPREAIVAAIIFAAAIVSSVVGFAFSAISGPLILYCVPDAREAVHIMMIASIGIQAYSVAGLARSIAWSRCVPFVLGGVLTLPLGFLLLWNLQPRTVVVVIGTALVAYGLTMLFRRPAHIAGSRRWIDALVGATGGITGPLAAFPGACITIWCAMRGWNKLEQRAVYQPYLLIMQAIGAAALFVLRPQGDCSPALLAYAVPGLAGAVLGLRVFHALSDAQFQRLMNLALIVSGGALMLK